MKRYIKSSTSKYLTLAKGIVIKVAKSKSETADMMREIAEHNAYLDVFMENDYYIWYIAYTEAQYDVYSGELDGNILTHKSLLSKLNLPNNYSIQSQIRYFSVDLNASHTGTVLISNTSKVFLSTKYDKELIEKLRSFFGVTESKRSKVDSSEWIPIQSSEFKQLFEEAGSKAKQAASAINQNYNGSRTEGSFRPAYAVCFAAIDNSTGLGIVKGGPDFLIIADDYEDYNSEKRRFAKELGINIEDLSFKTVFTENDVQGEVKDSNTRKGARALANHFAAAVIHEDSTISVEEDGWAGMHVLEKEQGRTTYLVYLKVDSTILDPKVDYDEGDTQCILRLPAHFSYTPEEAVNIVHEAFNTIM